jgi:hypothetical protein
MRAVSTPLAGTTSDSGTDLLEDQAPSLSQPAAGTVLTGPMRIAWYVGLAVFVVQFILLVIHSAYLWDHFDLTADFGQYSQAWQQIATGHLNPYDTTYAWNYPHYGYPFYQGDLELIMWPLSLLYWVWHSAFDLLLVQDAALAGAGLVAYRWVLEHLENHAPDRRFALIVGGSVLAVLVLQPWTYWAGSYDYHSEPLATFFLVLAGRDLWSGRRRGWIWIGCVLLCGNVATSYVAALGVAALISGRRRWRMGLLLIGVGVVWLAFVGLVHSGKGAALAAYAYLDNRTSVNDSVGGIFTIVTGMVVHPSIAGHVVRSRFGEVYNFVGGAGTVGIFSAVGGALSVAVLLPSVLNSSPSFISDIGGSQNFMAVVACAIGIAMLATWLTRQGAGRSRRWRTGLAAFAIVLAIGSVVETALFSAHFTPLSGQTFAKVDDATAAQLSAVSAKIPNGAETVVSQGVVGRFAERHVFYPYFDVFADGQTVPVYGPTVYVVLVPRQGIEQASVPGTEAAIALMRKLHARPLSARDGVYAFAWHVPKGQHAIVFPPG